MVYICIIAFVLIYIGWIIYEVKNADFDPKDYESKDTEPEDSEE